MKTIILLTLLLAATSAFASILLVTDMDDTIKVSHVLDPDSAMANAAATKNAFMGMPELYQSLVKMEGATHMHYLSNAPRRLMNYSHRMFLWRNDFPAGELILNRKVIDHEHKIKSLRKMIADHKPTKMILIGDNGEKDPEVYAKIRSEFPEIGGETYIHLAYSSLGFEGSFARPLLPGQIPWVTSLDLTLDLVMKGYLTNEAYTKVVKSVEQRALKEKNTVERNRQMMIPAWMDCRDATIPKLPLISNDLQLKIEDRCSREPIED